MGVINPQEAQDHVMDLEALMTNMKEKIATGTMTDVLKPNQLMLVLKASVRPLIQLKTKAGLDIEATTSKTKDLPEEQATRIELLATPDPDTPPLKNEKINSSTRLLAATYAFKMINTFSDGITQRGLQERYQVKAKQLATCITGRKYMSGTDRKRKRSRSDEGDHSSEKPSTSQ